MRAAKRSSYIVATPRRGKCCANWSALPRKPAAISNRDSASRAWTIWRRHTVTPNRLDACKQLNESYFSVLVRIERAHEGAERRGNDGFVENEENQAQVSLRFPRPLEIAARFHIPTAPTVALFINGKQIRKTQERSPAECAPELYSFKIGRAHV